MKKVVKNTKSKSKALSSNPAKSKLAKNNASTSKKKLVQTSKLRSNSATKKIKVEKPKAKVNVKKTISKAKPVAKPTKDTKATKSKAKVNQAPIKKLAVKVPQNKKASKNTSKKADSSKKPVVKKEEVKREVKNPVAKLSMPEETTKKNSSKNKKQTKQDIAKIRNLISDLLAKKKKDKQSVSKKLVPVASTKEVPHTRLSAGIYFSMEDLEEYLKTRNTSTQEDQKDVSLKSGIKLKSKKSSATATVQVPKKAIAAASIADILGFNPITENRAALEEKDVPAKWKKYYKLLIEMRERFENSPSDKAEMISNNNGELSHENSNQGMDAADIGSKNFERDMAFNLLSNEQNIISEVNDAIERIRNGTYGICEITGKQIPDSRLTAIPFTRCTIEGQRQKEIEAKRLKSSKSRSQYSSVELDEDDLPLSDLEDDANE